MKKSLTLFLALMTALLPCCAIAESEAAPILPADTALYYNSIQLEVPSYSDGTAFYVPLDLLMLALGGQYSVEDGKIVISIDPNMLPAETTEESEVPVSDVPAVSWAYLNHWINNEYGYLTMDDYIFDCFYGDDETQQQIIDLLNAVIENTDDVDQFINSVNLFVQSGGMFTEGLQKLAK